VVGLIRRDGREAPTPADFATLPSYVPMDPVSLNLALDTALRRTAFYRKWRLNSRPDPNNLTIYVFDSASPTFRGRVVDVLRNNAAFIAESNTIAVDYQLIATLWKRYFSEDTSYGSRSNLIAWVVAHEVGHLINKNESAHFRDASLLKGAATCEGTSDEQNADDYYAALVATLESRFVEVQVRLFSQIIEKELQRLETTRSRRWTFTSTFTRWSRRCTHAEYVIRAHRFIEGVARRTRDPSLTELARAFRVRLDEELAR
jgi:hypothetical protein